MHTHLKDGLMKLYKKLESLANPSRLDLGAKRDIRMRPKMSWHSSGSFMDFSRIKVKSRKSSMRSVSFKKPSAPTMLYSMTPPSPSVAMFDGPMLVDDDDDDDDGGASSEKSTYELFEDMVDVLLVDTFELAEGEEKTVKVLLADQITTWEIRLYEFQGRRFDEVIKNVSAECPEYVQIRAPSIIDVENGDEAEIEVHYSTLLPGLLRVLLNDDMDLQEKEVQKGKGVVRFKLNEKGTIRAILKTDKSIMEALKEVNLPFEQTLIYTRMECLYPGERFVPPQEVMILQDPLPLIRESVHALQGYPFGCAEQTSAKLGALALAYRYHESIKSGEESTVVGMIRQGIGRLFSEYYNEREAMFGMWDAGIPEQDITIQVLANLKPLYPILNKLHLQNYKEKLQDVVKKLIRDKAKSFSLGSYSMDFIPKGKISDPLDAALVMLAPDTPQDKIDACFNVIKSTAIKSETDSKWKSDHALAGDLQATAEVLKALARHESSLPDDAKKLYKMGLHYVMSNMINGRLFSTTDTLALIELFTSIPKAKTKIELNGEIIEVDGTFSTNDEFKAITKVYVHWIEEEFTNPFKDLLPSDNKKIKIKLEDGSSTVGSQFVLVIPAPEEMKCPVAAICLPPHVAMMKGGGNIQQHYLPFREDRTIRLELVSIRKGRGHIRVVIHDMYRKEQVIEVEPLQVLIK
ncbi:MAG: hypothetical protein ACTSRA_11430 [Promethearchaeota archaeon]